MSKTVNAAEVRSDMRLAVEVMELWRLCGKSRCRRARACCGNARRCGERLANWSEALASKDKRIGFAEAMQRLREQRA